MNLAVKVRRVFEDGRNVKAICSVTMDDMFIVHSVKVIETEKGFFVSMPYHSYKDNEGNVKRRDVFHAITAEARQTMHNAVIAAYEAELAAKTANE